MSDICFNWRKLVLSPNGPRLLQRPTRKHPNGRWIADKNARFVLMALANYMNADGTNAFPSQETLAKDTGLTARAIKGAMKRAADDGWIERTRTWVYEGGRRKGFRYSYKPGFPVIEHGERRSPFPDSRPAAFNRRPAVAVEESAW